ncbi:MAG TPA: phospholipase [Smithella sp.]|jgi:phosphatidylserine/phosphatidylglycerophosphate/cardiolipin synthase-like enzyme|nr:phospholipase [Smithella sp.]
MNRISLRRKIIIVLFVGIFLIAAAVFCAATSKKSGQNSPAESHEVILTNEDYFPALLKAIDEAQSEIFISIFSFKAGVHENSYPDRIMGHLAKAVKRGVKVYVILETTDNKSDKLNIQNKQTGKLLEEKGIYVFFDSPRKTTHTKLVVIDQRLLLLGSHNFTQSALRYNNEISVLLDSPDMAGNARNYILKIIKEAK